MTYIVLTFSTAIGVHALIWFIGPSDWGGWEILFQLLLIASAAVWLPVAKAGYSDEKTTKEELQAEQIKQEKIRTETMKREQLRAEQMKREQLQAERLLELERIKAIELERQQGIYLQNRMNERMQEVGLPRMAEDAIDFELLAAQWIYVWGDRDVEVTAQTNDSGIDVRSWCCLGQVKFYSNGKVGSPDIQRLKGASSIDATRDPVFFAFSTGYSVDAINFANQVGVALFQFDVKNLTFLSANLQAETVVKHLHTLL